MARDVVDTFATDIYRPDVFMTSLTQTSGPTRHGSTHSTHSCLRDFQTSVFNKQDVKSSERLVAVFSLSISVDSARNASFCSVPRWFKKHLFNKFVTEHWKQDSWAGQQAKIAYVSTALI